MLPRKLRIRVYPVASLIVMLTSPFVLGCSSTPQLSSSWNSDVVTIDGNANEWGSGLTNIKDTKVFVGVRNDQDYLYVCLTSTEPQFRRQLIGAGLSIWFESEDGKRMGLLYPIGMRQAGQPQFTPDEGQEPGDREHILDQALQDLEILGPGKDDRNLFSVVQTAGVSVKIGNSPGSVSYELKVPLKKSSDHPYAVEAATGSMLTLEIATGKFEGGPRGGDGSEGRMGGGGGGRRGRGAGGGMPGGGGMRGGGQRPAGDMARGSRPEPLDVSMKVRLAGASSDAGNSH